MGDFMIRTIPAAAAAVSALLLAGPVAAVELVGQGQSGNLPALEGGVAISMMGPVNLVVNGSFETGDFSGWEQGGDTSFTFVTDFPFAGGPTDGLYHAAFGPVDDFGGIFQLIPTVAGRTYRLSFDLAYTGGDPNGFGLLWGDPNNPETLVLAFDVGGFDYQTLSGPVKATTSSSLLLFAFYTPPSFWLLDNVSLTAIPEASTWAMLIAGFGLVGLSARRRRALPAA